jgi:hypothetical protein
MPLEIRVKPGLGKSKPLEIGFVAKLYPKNASKKM